MTAMGFSIDEKQGEYIAEIKLRNINKEYILKRIEELDTLKEEIESLKETLSDEKKIKMMIAAQLKQVSKKYGKDRKTEIIMEQEMEEIPEQELIEDYGIRLFLTEQNYFKKISLVSLRSAGEQKLKEDDKITFEIETTNKADILLFSNKLFSNKKLNMLSILKIKLRLLCLHCTKINPWNLMSVLLASPSGFMESYTASLC